MTLPAIVILVASLSNPGAARKRRLDALAHAASTVCKRPLAIGYLHADAALDAEAVTGVDATLLLGMACVESRLHQRARSNGGRGRYCGSLQVDRTYYGYSCRELQNARTGYRIGARHLKRWLRTRRDLRAAIGGYGGCSVNGHWSYVDRVLKRRNAIRRHVRTQ